MPTGGLYPNLSRINFLGPSFFRNKLPFPKKGTAPRRTWSTQNIQNQFWDHGSKHLWVKFQWPRSRLSACKSPTNSARRKPLKPINPSWNLWNLWIWPGFLVWWVNNPLTDYSPIDKSHLWEICGSKFCRFPFCLRPSILELLLHRNKSARAARWWYFGAFQTKMPGGKLSKTEVVLFWNVRSFGLFLRRFAPVVHFFWPCVFASFARFLGGKRKPQVTSKSALIEKNCSRSKQKRNDLEIFGQQSCDRHDHFSGTKRHSLLQSQVSYFV